MPKKDASTSCNDLCLDSSICDQVHFEKVIVETCTQEVIMENEQLKQEVAHYGGMIPGIHRTRHGPHHQRWPSPQDQGVRCTALIGVHRKATKRYCNTKYDIFLVTLPL